MHRLLLNEIIKIIKDKSLIGIFILLGFFPLVSTLLIRFVELLPLISQEEFTNYSFYWVMTLLLPFIGFSAFYNSFAKENAQKIDEIYKMYPYSKIQVYIAKLVAIILKLSLVIAYYALINGIIGSIVVNHSFSMGRFLKIFSSQFVASIPVFALVFLALIPSLIIKTSGWINFIVIFLTGGMVFVYYLGLDFKKYLVVTPLVDRILKPMEYGVNYLGLSYVYIILITLVGLGIYMFRQRKRI